MKIRVKHALNKGLFQLMVEQPDKSSKFTKMVSVGDIFEVGDEVLAVALLNQYRDNLEIYKDVAQAKVQQVPFLTSNT